MGFNTRLNDQPLPDPSIMGSCRTPGLGVQFVYKANVCCYESAARWPVRFIGHTGECPKCHNRMKAIEPQERALIPERGSFGQVVWGLEKGWGYHIITYDRRFWTANKVEEDLTDRDLRKDAIHTTTQLWLAVQKPSAWFDPDNVVIASVGRRAHAVLGKLHERFIGKTAPQKWLNLDIDNSASSIVR